MSPSDRLQALKQLLDSFLSRTPELWDEPLYKAVIEHTGNSYQRSHIAK
jgi:hypothetical protein